MEMGTPFQRQFPFHRHILRRRLLPSLDNPCFPEAVVCIMGASKWWGAILKSHVRRPLEFTSPRSLYRLSPHPGPLLTGTRLELLSAGVGKYPGRSLKLN